MIMPSVNFEVVSALFSVVAISLAFVWGINKAVIFSKFY